jgi:hypothetical protein
MSYVIEPIVGEYRVVPLAIAMKDTEARGA